MVFSIINRSDELSTVWVPQDESGTVNCMLLLLEFLFTYLQAGFEKCPFEKTTPLNGAEN
jgi:hypothetical protein